MESGSGDEETKQAARATPKEVVIEKYQDFKWEKPFPRMNPEYPSLKSERQISLEILNLISEKFGYRESTSEQQQKATAFAALKGIVRAWMATYRSEA